MRNGKTFTKWVEIKNYATTTIVHKSLINQTKLLKFNQFHLEYKFFFLNENFQLCEIFQLNSLFFSPLSWIKLKADKKMHISSFLI